MGGSSAKRPRPHAPELRTDRIKGHEVILAPQRLARPGAIQLRPWDTTTADACPFCRGHEDQVPQPLIAIPSEANWRVRIVPNKYPAVLNHATVASPAVPEAADARLCYGSHEVVIESADHVTSLTQLSTTAVAESLGAVQQRFRELRAGGDVSSVIFFKNYGPAAGASLPHVHSQIIALPHIPPRLRRELDAAHRDWKENDTCFLCDRLMTAAESERQILQTASFALFCPHASRFPYEAWIAPLEHQSHFEQASATDLAQLASILHAHLARLEQALPHVCYNLVLHSAPFDTYRNDHYHWHFEVIPRIAILAGFELASGQFLNPVDPVEAAKRLQPER